MKLRYSLVIALALGGCNESSSSNSNGSNSEEKGAGAPVELGGKGGVNAGFKADCIDCAEDGDNAFVQLGLGSRFYKAGDSWQVAYQLRSDSRVQMQQLDLLQKVDPDVGMVVLDFKVLDTSTRSIGGNERATARIEITQGEGRGSMGQLIQGKEIRVDEQATKIVLELDDLLRPVSVTEFGGAYPNGQTRQLDPREALRDLDSAFPYVVPNAYLNAPQVDLPELSETLGKMALVASPDYAAPSYFHFDLKGRGLESAEQVYWAEGDLWPFLVETPYATGVLVSQSK